MRKHKLQAVWENKDCAVNGWLSIPDGFCTEVMARQGWDSLTIDMQHGLIDYAAMTRMLTAIATTDSAAVVRAPWLDEGMLMKILDAGADGLICPMINTPQDAQRLADAVRYPPNGKRSTGPIRARLVHGADYQHHADEAIVVLAMIETAEAVNSADDILATPGIDGVYVGPGDLALSLGCEISFTPTAAPVVEAIDAILSAAKRNKVRAGIHTGSVEYAAKMRAKGFDLVTIMSDARFIEAGARQVLADFRQ